MRLKIGEVYESNYRFYFVNFKRLNGLVYLDYYSATIDKDRTLKDEVSYDGLHPNADGYKLMQPLAEEAIKRAVKR